MTSGYSGTPIAQKLGIKAGSRVLLDGSPDAFELLSPGATVRTRASGISYDVGVVFVTSLARLANRWEVLEPTIARLWVAWPKRASRVLTDLDDNVVREFGLSHGRVDVKVCAIDETWSALAFVVRVRDR